MTPAVLSALPMHPAPLVPALAGLPTAFTPSTTAVGGNVYLTAAVGLLPLVVFFVLMGVFKVATHWCAIISLVIAAVTAVTLFHMPVGMTVMSATQGMALGFVPIIYIIIAAVWLYNLTDVSGRSKDLKAVFNVIGKGDMRAQALIVAFSFCGLLEGLATGVGHFFTPSISYELTAVLASLLGLAASYVFLLVWTPTTPEEYRSQVAAEDAPDRERVILALLPYVLVVVIIATTKLWTLGINLDKAFKATDLKIKWPGVYGQLLNAKGEASTGAIYNLQTLSNPGTWIFLTAIIVTFIYAARSVPGKFEMSVGKGFATLAKTCYTLRMAILTIAAVMALAYVMNFSGQTSAIGAALAATGAAYAFLSPALGWVGTAVAGSATSAGALFANLQATAAKGAGLDPKILLAANTIGGGLGKIVSPQNLAIASTAVDAPGTDAEILKKAAPYSIGLLLVLGTLVFLASQVGLGV